MKGSDDRWGAWSRWLRVPRRCGSGQPSATRTLNWPMTPISNSAFATLLLLPAAGLSSGRGFSCRTARGFAVNAGLRTRELRCDLPATHLTRSALQRRPSALVKNCVRRAKQVNGEGRKYGTSCSHRSCRSSVWPRRVCPIVKSPSGSIFHIAPSARICIGFFLSWVLPPAHSSVRLCQRDDLRLDTIKRLAEAAHAQTKHNEEYGETHERTTYRVGRRVGSRPAETAREREGVDSRTGRDGRRASAHAVAGGDEALRVRGAPREGEPARPVRGSPSADRLPRLRGSRRIRLA